MSRIGLAISRSLARFDTLVAGVTLFLAGMAAADEAWLRMAILLVVGLVFLVASGDYVWRKGFVAGRGDSR